jgi:hypothetical protein
VRGDAAERINPFLVDLDGDAGQVRQVQLHRVDLFPIEVVLDRDRLELLGVLPLLQGLRDIALAERLDRRERLQRRLQVRGLLRHQDGAVARRVGRHRNPEAVDDEAARREQDAVVDAVLVRQQRISRRITCR